MRQFVYMIISGVRLHTHRTVRTELHRTEQSKLTELYMWWNLCGQLASRVTFMTGECRDKWIVRNVSLATFWLIMWMQGTNISIMTRAGRLTLTGDEHSNCARVCVRECQDAVIRFDCAHTKPGHKENGSWCRNECPRSDAHSSNGIWWMWDNPCHHKHTLWRQIESGSNISCVYVNEVRVIWFTYSSAFERR